MNIGDTVFVWWYGKPVQGMIVENKEITPMLASMVVVRIPIQGVHASALFMPKNVFETEEQILFKHKIQRAEASKQFEVKISDNESEGSPIQVAKDAYARLIEFKNAHWDNEHNHIEVSALNDFYDLWVEYMTERLNAMQSKEYKNKMAIQAPSTPAEAANYHPEANAYDGGPKPEAYRQTTPPASKPRKPAKKVTVTQLDLFA